MNKIVEIIFGSHMYGTATEDSDLDRRAVYIPDASDILLQKIKNHIAIKDNREDEEIYSLHGYLKHVLEGRHQFVDMLFAPQEFIITTSQEWKTIKQNISKLISEKYGILAYKHLKKYKLNSFNNLGIFLFKELSHAIRISYQAIELLNYGNITFPLEKAGHILDIKLGNIETELLKEEMEYLSQILYSALKNTSLSDEPDYEFADLLIEEYYGKECMGSCECCGGYACGRK